MMCESVGFLKYSQMYRIYKEKEFMISPFIKTFTCMQYLFSP